MGRPRSLTEGNIFSSLIRFAVPVLFTLFLQALYGGVDLLVVGQFAQTADVSGVATGSMLLQTVTMVVTGLSMGITILVGERIGRREPEDAGRAIGGGICLFACFAVLLTAVLVGGAEVLARLMHAPEHAFHQTVLYIRICGAGSLFIVAYNVLGSIFRGIGDSRTPLLTVAIACVINIFGDLLLAKKALKYGILTSVAAGLVMALLTFFHGDLLSAIFSPDPEVVAASHSYLKAYAIDCMLTPFLFCFTGYYNGCEKTLFVMIQGIIGAFFVRIPVAYLMSRMAGATLFQIGLSTPASSVVQILLCLSMFLFLERRSAGQSHASLKGSADP